ncbi:MAG: acetyl-CoA C-acyltransferase, partial [Armatimonadota bacterium]|nr:acetyl-CoA C-acyltransferase [Armatimonadota bacterium]
MREAVVVTAVRSAVGKARRGTLADARPDELAAQVIRSALEHTPGLDPREVDDVILGCAF